MFAWQGGGEGEDASSILIEPWNIQNSNLKLKLKQLMFILFSDASHFSLSIEFELSSGGQCHNASVSTEGIYKV